MVTELDEPRFGSQSLIDPRSGNIAHLTEASSSAPFATQTWLVQGTVGAGGDDSLDGNRTVKSTLTRTRIPEPAALALVGIAPLGGTLKSRRRA